MKKLSPAQPGSYSIEQIKMRLEIGQLIKTNYDTGPYPYKVISIIRGCTCTHLLDEIENIEKPLPPHLHLRLEDMKDGKKDSYLNYYDEETLTCVKHGKDRIILCENIEPIQKSLTFT